MAIAPIVLSSPLLSYTRGVGVWVGCPCRRGLHVLTRPVFLHEVNLKLFPRLACRRILVPLVTHVGEVACGEDRVLGRSHDLFRNVQDLYSVGKFHGRINFIDDGLEWIINIVLHIHARRVELEV